MDDEQVDRLLTRLREAGFELPFSAAGGAHLRDYMPEDPPYDTSSPEFTAWKAAITAGEDECTTQNRRALRSALEGYLAAA